MAERAVFYRLTHKFVHDERGIPETARQVIYYSLAIGHHVGVMDCFQSLMEMQLADFSRWIARMPEGPGRHKLEGVLKWGEIEINHSHAGDLLPALKEALPRMDADEARWAGVLAQCLQEMAQEPALYLMVRRSA
jgi:hydrogenase-4 component J